MLLADGEGTTDFLPEPNVVWKVPYRDTVRTKPIIMFQSKLMQIRVLSMKSYQLQDAPVQ
jgi:hypothetical protein